MLLRVTAGLVVTTLLAVVAPRAHAASLRSFAVRDSGSRITWAVDVCAAGGVSVHKFSAQLWPDSGWPVYTRTWNGGHTAAGCDRWTMRTSDIWNEGVWWSKLTVVMGDGSILRTITKDFYID